MSRPQPLPLILVAALAHTMSPPRVLAQATPAPTGVEQTTSVQYATPNAGNKETSLQRIQRYVMSINKEASTPEGEDAVVARLSQQLQASPDSLRAEHALWGLGYGEVAMVHGFAKSSKVPGITPNDVVAMRNSGTSWEDIGKKLGVKVDTVAARMKKTVNPHAKPGTQGQKSQQTKKEEK